MSYENILTAVDAGVAVITLNRPQRMNAWTAALGAELRHALATFELRDDVRAIVVTGAGRAFCAGADLEAGGDTFAADRRAEAHALAERWRPPIDKAPHEMNTPVVAAMNGPAVGVGITLAMEYDIRIAAEDAKYGFVFTRRGVVPELGSMWLLPRLVGASRALELLLTGRLFRGREGADLGVFSAAVPAGDVLPRALDVARDIAANTGPVSAAIVKRFVYQCLEDPDRARALRREEALFHWSTKRPDAAEGPVAFLEKRAPRWTLSKNGDCPEDLLGR